VAQTGFGLAAFSVAAEALVVPVPARPLGWWFLAAALACATVWVAGRRAWAWAPAAALGASAVTAVIVDFVVSRGAPAVLTGGWLGALAGVAAAVGTGAAVAGGFADRRAEPGRSRGLPALVAAATIGAAVVLASAGPAFGGPGRVFPPAEAGARAVVVVPHIDDEAAFAGETVAWLGSHGYRVTIVVATDSRGGRALDKDPAYRKRRDAALAASVRDLGARGSVVFEDVRDGARMSSVEMERAILRDLRASGLLGPSTVLVTVSGTGHANHLAAFAAVRRAAAEAGLPLFIAWGYGPGHDLVSRPAFGAPLAFDGGPAASEAKAGAIDRYIGLYEDHYAFTLPRAIVLGRGAHDVLSLLSAPKGTVVAP
jgi:LmbE family N-acetylglucosaminyl deacetylase